MATLAMKGSNPHSNSPPSAENPVATVTTFSHDCRGVARLDGKAVFIDGALPGETVRFRYLHRQKRYDTAEVVEIIKPSPDRVTPSCPHYGTCGGCGLQHMRPEVQLQSKQQILSEQLERLGKVKPESWLAPITGPAFGYRRRARLGVRQVASAGGVVIGFRQKNKSFLADLETCLVLEPMVSALLPALHVLIDGLSCPDRIPQIEVAGGTNASSLVIRHLVPLTYEDRERLAAFGEANGIRIYLQPGKPDSIAPLWPSVHKPLYYRIPGFEVDIRFEPADFIQINDAVNNAMVARVVELLEPTAKDAVLDLFCGLGNFTLPLARRAGRVLGVESEKALIERARANAQLNKIMNVEFVHADLYRESFNASWNHFAANKLLLDPPRSGAIEIIKSLVEPLPSRIVYVSCYPATLARDSEYLVQVLGYRLTAAGVMDMFPQTSHVESMALFIKS
ncbi:MAG: 23S rRNA (uracil(1939)-C(5))-methyltransferase RlmD [Gammaproteobacteria bacterium]|nr:23S rRNA (uracil(1939)-C(5))-methyltransferase RlmD [Gammaproteobacteria bacterium]MDH3406587.1 23S rRNA (uracil(1939)-C(5))-methyltransferase RlmD [Gammaproteobacteria bacterium]MDH5486938.1 23S rRNA (uracil(1939)-C(5))-methyltransferase RlmD [Gammaproteobacteria bacterium]